MIVLIGSVIVINCKSLFVISHICIFAEEGNTPKRSRTLGILFLDGKLSLDSSLTVYETIALNIKWNESNCLYTHLIEV